jgi:3-hydroxyacyl-CoA dehydrogenase/enoyl-CoA hydratase/3-hydroxybutyryl-CoA epimerase
MSMAFFQSKNLSIRELAGDVAMLVLDAEAKLNHVTPALVDELSEAIERVAGETRFVTLVLCSAKAASFCHGLDPEWLAGHPAPDVLTAYALRGQQLCGRLAGLPIPSVAVIAGPCLGAGLELALACDYRVLVNRPTTIVGLTDIELGLIPCWGGTQRLPRLVGLENSIKMLSAARRIRPAEALAIGLADALCEEGDTNPPEFLAAPAKRDWSVFPRRTWRQRLLESNALGRWLILRGARRILRERLPQEMPAPWEALETLQMAARSADLAAGLESEREAIARLAQSTALHNLVRLRLERDARRLSAPKSQGARYLRAIGIVGATEVGRSLVQQLAARGCQVVLHDSDRAALGYAVFELHRTFQAENRRGLLSPEAALRCLSAIRGTTSWQHFDELDLVLDTSDDGQRAERFRHLDGITTPATILASTGVADTAAQLRAGLKHPRRVAVLHFAGPAAHEALVELAHAEDAAQPVVQRLGELAGLLGKVCVPVADQPGLLVLRIWMPAFNEAALLLREGMPPDRIDEAMVRFGTASGPLEMMDRLGLDAITRLADVLEPALADRIVVEAGFAEMVRQGMLGVQSGAGFFRHSGKRRRANPRAVSLWWRGPAEARLSRSALSYADQMDLAQRRMTSLMILEGYYCLRERIVGDATTLDFALATAGWAPHRGGPLAYARQLGAETVLAQLEELARDFGPRFTPPPRLGDLLRGAGFSE